MQKEIVTLLNNVKGLEIVNPNSLDDSCGYKGTFSLVHEAISSALAEQVIQRAIIAEAEYIIVTEATCLMQINAYIQKHELPMKTIHLVDVLASGWEV